MRSLAARKTRLFISVGLIATTLFGFTIPGSLGPSAGALRPHDVSTCNAVVPSGSVIGMAATHDNRGYWIATNYGAVIACGDAPYLGDADTDHNYPIVGFAALPDDSGYYLVASDGGIFTYGKAPFYGSMGGQPLNRPIVGMALDPATGGYWLFGGDGGIFAFNAPFYGSTGSMSLNEPIVGMAASGGGAGYWLVGSDGGIFAYHAPFLGSTGSIRLNKPVVGMAADQASGGYWLVASDGGIFAYNAPFLGSTGSITLNRPILGMESAPDGSGYRFVASDGGIFTYGSPFFGSAVEPPVTTQPPGSAPTCSVTLSNPAPKEYMGETVAITSNVPSFQVLMAKIYTGTTAFVGDFSTDSSGRAVNTVSITTAPIGARAVIAVSIGPAFCYSGFIPS
jgi:hypothetical protein